MGWIDEWIKVWIDGWMAGWMDGLMEGRTDGWMDQMVGGVGGWMGSSTGLMEGWMDRYIFLYSPSGNMMLRFLTNLHFSNFRCFIPHWTASNTLLMITTSSISLSFALWTMDIESCLVTMSLHK